MDGLINVVLVDASPLFQELIAKLLTSDPAIRLLACVDSGARAMAILRSQPVDVVLVDLDAAERDGISLWTEMRAQHVAIRVLLLGGPYYERADLDVKSYSLGVHDWLCKPLGTGELAVGAPLARELLAKVRTLASQSAAAMISALSAAGPPPAATAGSVVRSSAPARTAAIRALAIGCSTGGPEALTTILRGLPARRVPPILVVQHMPAIFTTAFAAQLEKDTWRSCREGVQGEIVLPGVCYVAPGGYHMSVNQGGPQITLQLDQKPAQNFCRPSVDVLFRTVAACYGTSALAVVLTGMGRDGAVGARAIRQRGGQVLVQDEASSVVWGMPGAVVQAGLASEILPLSAIAGRLRELLGIARK